MQRVVSQSHNPFEPIDLRLYSIKPSAEKNQAVFEIFNDFVIMRAVDYLDMCPGENGRIIDVVTTQKHTMTNKDNDKTYTQKLKKAAKCQNNVVEWQNMWIGKF